MKHAEGPKRCVGVSCVSFNPSGLLRAGYMWEEGAKVCKICAEVDPEPLPQAPDRRDKQCTICKEMLDYDRDFYHWKTGQHAGYAQPGCKECRKAQSRRKHAN